MRPRKSPTKFARCSRRMPTPNAAIRSKVALVYDYEAKWLFEIHPQGADFHYPRFAFEYYSALRALGLDVDVVPVDAPLDGYSLIVVPPLPVVPDDFARASREFGRAGRAGSAYRFEDRGPADSGESAAGRAGFGAAAARVARRIDAAERDRSGASRGQRRRGVGGRLRASLARFHRQRRRRIRSTCARVSPTAIPRMCEAARFITSRACSTMRSPRACSRRSPRRRASKPQALGDSVRISRRGALTYVFNYGDTPHTLTDVADDALRDRLARHRTARRGASYR